MTELNGKSISSLVPGRGASSLLLLTLQSLLGLLIGSQDGVLDLVQPQHCRGVLCLLGERDNHMRVNRRTPEEQIKKAEVISVWGPTDTSMKRNWIQIRQTEVYT